MLLGQSCIAGELGPADLSAQQMAEAFPASGTKWKAWCGSVDSRVDCLVELGAEGLIVNGSHEVPYSSIVRSEKWDSMGGLARISKLDPVWAGWKNYRKKRTFDTLANTVLIEYKSLDGQLKPALFNFPPDQISDWYGFGNAMRLITYGARPVVTAGNESE